MLPCPALLSVIATRHGVIRSVQRNHQIVVSRISDCYSSIITVNHQVTLRSISIRLRSAQTTPVSHSLGSCLISTANNRRLHGFLNSNRSCTDQDISRMNRTSRAHHQSRIGLPAFPISQSGPNRLSRWFSNFSPFETRVPLFSDPRSPF